MNYPAQQRLSCSCLGFEYENECKYWSKSEKYAKAAEKRMKGKKRKGFIHPVYSAYPNQGYNEAGACPAVIGHRDSSPNSHGVKKSQLFN